jgi:hypothetical protein
MKKKIISELRELAKHFPLRFQLQTTYRPKNVAKALSGGRFDAQGYKGFVPVNHVDQLKRIYENEGQRDMQKTLAIYTVKDRIAREKFERLHPGEYQKIIARITEAIQKRQAQAAQ